MVTAQKTSHSEEWGDSFITVVGSDDRILKKIERRVTRLKQRVRRGISDGVSHVPREEDGGEMTWVEVELD